MRQVAEEAETIYYVYVIDDEEHLLGVLPLHNLVLTGPTTPVSDLMVTDPIRVHAETDQETAARLLTDHNLLALPVVDDEDHLLGIITEDDIAEISGRGGDRGHRAPRRLPTARHPVPAGERAAAGPAPGRLAVLFLFVAGLLTAQVLRVFEGRLAEIPR